MPGFDFRAEQNGRRSLANWLSRAGLAVVVAVVGTFGCVQTFAQVMLRNREFATAYRLAPWDGRMGAAYADALTLSGAIDSNTASIAKAALSRDPTAVGAVASLAVHERAFGRPELSDRLFAYSERLSRRDLSTQLWKIETAVGRNDIGGALLHYDIALRTSAKAQDVLFPILADAIKTPEIRVALVATLSRHPHWSDAFITFVAAAAPDPRAVAQLFARLPSARVSIPPDAYALLVNALFDRQEYNLAWAVYAAWRPRSDSSQSRDPNFMAMMPPSRFDWIVVANTNSSAAILRDGALGVFDFATGPNMSAPLLQQVELLPPGTYRLQGQSAALDQPERSRPYWVLTCSRNNRELGRVVIPNSSIAQGRFAGSLMIPQDCPAQVLSLVVRSTDAIGGVSGQIKNVVLQRIPVPK